MFFSVTRGHHEDIGAASAQTATYIAGIESAKVTGAAVYVNSKGQLGVLASAERYKSNIQSMGPITEKLQRLRPVSFHLKADPAGAVQYGLIAEEVDKLYPELVIRGETGEIQGVRYDELAPMLLNVAQQQQRLIASQNKRMAAESAKLRRLNDSMQAGLAQLRNEEQRIARR